MKRGCVNRIRLWPLRRDNHSGVLIGEAGQGVLIGPECVCEAKWLTLGRFYVILDLYTNTKSTNEEEEPVCSKEGSLLKDNADNPNNPDNPDSPKTKDISKT